MTNANSKIKYGLNDTILVNKKEDILIIDPFIPSYMNFQTIFRSVHDAQSELSKHFARKKLVHQNHSYLNYALIYPDQNSRYKHFNDQKNMSHQIP